MREWASATILGLALLSAAPARAQRVESVPVASGETVAITLDASNDGAATVTSRVAAPLQPYQVALANSMSQASTGPLDSDNKAIVHSDVPMPPLEADSVRLIFAPVPGKAETVLILENGYGRGLVYRATIHVGTGAQPTDVCLVMPMKRNVEHWPYRIDSIDLSRLTLVPWSEGDPVPCV